MTDVDTATVFSCSICLLQLKRRQNLKDHYFYVHDFSKEKITELLSNAQPSKFHEVSCLDDSCDGRFKDYFAMSTHMILEHPQSIIGEGAIVDERFPSADAYETWKQGVRDLCGTDFRVTSSRQTKDRKVVLMRCRCSGPSMATGQKQRYGKVLRRTVERCTAHLKVTSTMDGVVTVTGALFHVGHLQDSAKLPLTDIEKGFLLGLLKAGHPTQKIIDRCRDQYPATSRLHYTTQKDLRTVASVLTPGRLHENDVTSFLLRSEEEKGDDGIQLVNLSTTDSTQTVIVIITPTQLAALKENGHRGLVVDDTFNVTKYVLRLTTILVVDDLGRGIPAAFLLSHKLRTEEAAILFDVIRILFPSFHPDYFMSDDTGVFWNGFVSVFPHLSEHTRKLLCRWHILQTWIRKAKSRMTNGKLYVGEEDFVLLKKNLRTLVRVSDKKEFHDRFVHILDWLQSAGYQEYADYLGTQYGLRNDEWSAVEKDNVPFTTSMHSESWHSYLKMLLLNRKKNVRLDALVDTLIKSPLNIVQRHRIEDARGYTGKRQSANHGRHRNAISVFGKGGLQVDLICDTQWSVSSRRTPGISHTIRVGTPCACGHSRCHPCKQGGHPCPCQFICSCLDKSAGISCAHVHALCCHMKLTGKEVAQAPASGDDAESIAFGPDVGLIGSADTVCVARNCTQSTDVDTPQDIKKVLFDGIEQNFSRIRAASLILMKSVDEQSLEKLQLISREFTNIANQLPMDGFVPRADCQVGSQRAVPIRGYSIDKRKRRRGDSTSREEESKLPEVTSVFCYKCKMSTAPTVGRDTTVDDWFKCSCSRWYHSTCVSSQTYCFCAI